MATCKVYSLANEEIGQIELNDQIFAVEINRHLIWEAVRHFLATGRAGTAATKTRNAVAGSRKKLWRQKGTGRARVGDVKTPKWRGGGTVHGPQPRDFSYAFPKKKRRGAICCALSDKWANGQIKVVEHFELSTHKTKDLRLTLEALEAPKKTLLVDGRDNLNLIRACNNLPTVKVVTGFGLNIHDLLKYDYCVISKSAVSDLEEALKR
jgi:large subunit ribosomal protein L4